MRQQSSTRTIAGIAVAAVTVTAVAAAGLSLAQPGADNASSRPASAATRSAPEVQDMNRTPASAEKEEAGAQPQPAPGTAQNYSTTTVTVNGQTTTVTGPDASYNEHYVSEDGTTKVDISVRNESSATGSTNTSSPSESPAATRHRTEAPMD